jgi:hypothetical protein
MRSVLLALVLGLAACASGPSATPNNSAAQAGSGGKPRQICKEEATTGSNITHMVCRSPEQVDEDRDSAQTWRRQPTAVPASK